MDAARLNSAIHNYILFNKNIFNYMLFQFFEFFVISVEEKNRACSITVQYPINLLTDSFLLFSVAS